MGSDEPSMHLNASELLAMVRRLALFLMARKCWVRKVERTAAQQMTRCFGELGPTPSSAFRMQRSPTLCRLLHPLCALPVLRGCSPSNMIKPSI